jgi:capping protein beta
MENKMRSTLNEIYFGKTKDIVNDLRSVRSLSEERGKMAMQRDIAAALTMRKTKTNGAS